jgi:glycosidase
LKPPYNLDGWRIDVANMTGRYLDQDLNAEVRQIIRKTMSYTGREVFRAHTLFAAPFPWRVQLHNMNALDTHDTPRFLTHAQLGTVPVALGLSVTMPGVPVVFAGDEFGLMGDDGEQSRTPIPWDQAEASASTIGLRPILHGVRVAGHTGSAVLTGGYRSRAARLARCGNCAGWTEVGGW